MGSERGGQEQSTRAEGRGGGWGREKKGGGEGRS